MAKEMVISSTPHETRVAILEDGQLCEIYVEREKEFALVGSIYKGRVTRVLPGMQSSFVDIGLDSDAFLYVSDFLEEIEELDHVVTTVEEKVQKMEDQGGQVFSTDTTGHTSSVEPVDVEPFVDPGEVPAETAIADAQPAITARPAESAPARDSHGSPRPHQYENRGRDNRGFGRGGRGRGGRNDRKGGSGGGGRRDNRRFGRDLPHSKYASHRPYEPAAQSEGSAAPGDFVPVLLPGESLARLKEAPQTPVSVAPTAEANIAVSPANFETETREQLKPKIETSPESSYQPARAFEPLPGESLSHFSSSGSATTTEEVEDATHDDEFDRHAERAIENSVAEKGGLTESVEASEDVQALTEEEAVSLAEQVAEAQREEAAREQQESHLRDGESHEDAAHEDEFAPADDTHEEASETETSEESDEAHSARDDADTAEIEAVGEHQASEASFGEEAGGPSAQDAGQVTPTAAVSALDGEKLSGEPQPTSATVRGDFRARMQHPSRRGGRDQRPNRGRRDDRGRRPQQGHSGGHRTPPRRVQLIADMLKQGQEIIVQIAKEPLGKKGARITSHVALPGRFLVYMPTLDHTGVSRKIASAEERSRLRHLVNEAKGSFGGGFIVRTAASQAAPDEVRADVEFLTRTWAEIKGRGDQRKAPALLHRDLNLVERILRDYLTSDFTAIWVDSEDEYTKVVDFVSRFQPQLVSRVKLYTKETPVYEEFGIQQEIDKGLRPKVWLKSGGYIVINHTEALVAIDVNTGKFVGKGSTRLEDTIVRTNLEAVKEIVRQMRLRDLGGIIVIDFIDMEERRNREKVMAALEDALKADRAPSKVLRFNEFGLVAITRKRTKQALERTLCQPCPYCTGSGMVKSIPTLCYEIQAEARKMSVEIESGSLTLRVHPEIAKALKTRESSLMEELEGWTKKSIIIQADPTLHWEQYDIY
ncbi:MAG: Rne/Rng family ribonuclease [Candidatus Acidiferrales bacterium]